MMTIINNGTIVFYRDWIKLKRKLIFAPCSKVTKQKVFLSLHKFEEKYRVVSNDCKQKTRVYVSSWIVKFKWMHAWRAKLSYLSKMYEIFLQISFPQLLHIKSINLRERSLQENDQ